MRVRILILLMFLSFKGISQTYVELVHSLTNEAGTIAGKSNVSIEVGKQWDVFSLGIALGKNSLEKFHGKDTSTYLEIRPNLNVFQQGKFTNTFTAGIGYVFNANNSLLTELTSGIEYSSSDHIHVNAIFGQYYYSGKYDSQSVTFFGLGVMYYFLPFTKKGGIIKQ